MGRGGRRVPGRDQRCRLSDVRERGCGCRRGNVESAAKGRERSMWVEWPRQTNVV